MPYKENLLRAVELKKELDAFRPLTQEVEQRIMQKFRLDWNYHSSNIEGNKLSYGETKALLLFGVTAQAKPLHDHLEMQGHDEAIKWLEELIAEKRPLNETFICQLHELILKEPYEMPAQTPDGKPTKRMITLGKYKTVPNHVLTQTGEMFYFATPEETPSKMADLMEWYKNESAKSDMNPVLLAIEFHYRFIRIHPFDDGNGRLARLLMNFILMKHGYPPAIVKTEDKENYFAALQQADAGNLGFFFDYVTALVNHSLELMLKGARGENIDEDDDLDKQLALLKQEVDAEDEDNEIKLELTETVFGQCMESWCFTLFEKLAAVTVKFNDFYSKPGHSVSFMLDGKGPFRTFSELLSLNALQQIYTVHKNDKALSKAEAYFEAAFGAYKKGGLNPFGCMYRLTVDFDKYNYKLSYPVFSPDIKLQKNIEIQRLLHKPVSDEEINMIVKAWGQTLYEHLQYNRKNLNKKTDQ
ncbi:Fic family protein [Saccharicrinis sp. FJH62]|uniref:Fic family protein n=1 Tax=Saccharicrinis sp. FJH62 TaxID=3344657 RepID=UPI0035D4CF0E